MPTLDAQIVSPTSHRLPTVSASQALQSLSVRGSRTISTGLESLDNLLSPPSLPGHKVLGGYPRGKVTEIFGPSGVGKTTFGIQAAVNVLHEGQAVVWVDTSCAGLIVQRFHDLLQASSHGTRGVGQDAAPSASSITSDVDGHFRHVTSPTLAHLLALFMHPPASFPPRKTDLVFIDSLSTLIDNAYPRAMDNKPKTEQSKWVAGRRFTVINEIMSTFSKFAALHDLAVVITCQTITRMRGASRAVLVPAISGVEWENGVTTRLVLFRDWVRQGKFSSSAESDRLRKTRFAGLLKTNGLALAEQGGVGSVVPFAIENVSLSTSIARSHVELSSAYVVKHQTADPTQTGLCDINIATDNIATRVVVAAETRPPKRLLTDADEDAREEPNSDELYGWIEDDEVAAEGLLIDEAPTTESENTILQKEEHQSRGTKAIRLSNV